MIKPKKYFFDTEFIEAGPFRPIYLISLGLVCEDGRELYIQNENCPFELASPWVKENVYPHLIGFDTTSLTITDGFKWTNFNQIHIKLLEFILDINPQFWAYYAAYDWVAFVQCFGILMNLPERWPKYCHDLKQVADALGNPRLPRQESTAHNALEDARHNMKMYDYLVGHQLSGKYKLDLFGGRG